jgi:hypothetical protein
MLFFFALWMPALLALALCAAIDWSGRRKQGAIVQCREWNLREQTAQRECKEVADSAEECDRPDRECTATEAADLETTAEQTALAQRERDARAIAGGPYMILLRCADYGVQFQILHGQIVAVVAGYKEVQVPERLPLALHYAVVRWAAEIEQLVWIRESG